VRISTPHIGVLLNTVTTSRDAQPWTFGVRALMHNLASRGLLCEIEAIAVKDAKWADITSVGRGA